MKMFKDRRNQAEDCRPDPDYDPQPIFFDPVTCPFCGGAGCIMCEDQTPIKAARLRLPDMTIKRRP
jgi:hypothetical protein